MRIKLIILTLSILISQISLAAIKEVHIVDVDTSLLSTIPNDNQILYGWKIFSWADWLSRPSAGPLMLPGDYNKQSLEVFEAHSSGIVRKPVSAFTKEYLHNINTIRKLDPNNQHQQLPGPKFSVQSRIEFPSTWAKIIIAAKNAKILDDDSAPYLELNSEFVYASKQSIDNSQQLQRIIRLLDSNGNLPSAINIQGIKKANQIAAFGTIITMFYEIDGNRTLIVNYFALALKKRILDLGVGNLGINLTGRSVLLGESSVLNTPSGIGAGLPIYTLEFFEKMLMGL